MIVDVVEDPETGLSAAMAVVHETGLAFGGTRFSPESSIGEVQELAQCMDVKLRPYRTGIGGAKAGFFCSPEHPGLPRLMAVAADAWRPILKSRVVLGKDMGATNARMEEFYRCVGFSQLAPVDRPGMPQWLRDFPGYRSHMTGQGVCWALSEAASDRLQGLTVAIQGAGAVGVGAGVRLIREGALVWAMSDETACFTFRHPLTEQELLRLVGDGRIHASSSIVKAQMPRESLFSQGVDALVLAANSYSVGEKEASAIAAPWVVEGSNFGLTDSARELLDQRKKIVLPDVIASSASAAMVAIQLEASGEGDPEELWQRVEQCIRVQTREGLEKRGLLGVTLRHSAFSTAGL